MVENVTRVYNIMGAWTCSLEWGLLRRPHSRLQDMFALPWNWKHFGNYSHHFC